MRKLAAIILLILFLFNLTGYRLFFHYLGERSDSHYTSIINKEEYDESQLLTIRVNLNMPYLVDRTEFERVDGEIEIDGQVYKYVKRRIYNGQLVLMCLPNNDRTKLQAAENNYTEFSLNIAATKNSTDSPSKSGFNKNAFTDYDQIIGQFRPAILISIGTSKVPDDEQLHTSIYLNDPGKPPELAA